MMLTLLMFLPAVPTNVVKFFSKNRVLIFLSIIFILFISGCSPDSEAETLTPIPSTDIVDTTPIITVSPPTPTSTNTPLPPSPTPDPLAEIEEYILQIDSLSIGESGTNESPLPSVPPQIRHDIGVSINCERTQHDVTENLDSILLFDPNIATLWPGSILQGNSLHSGNYAGINLDRTPGAITLSDLYPAVVSAQIEEPSKATVQQAINDLLPDEPTPPEARISYSVEETYSFEQSMFQIGAMANFVTPVGNNSVVGGLDFVPSDEENYVVIRLVQPYYTISFEGPRSPVSFIENSTLDDVSLYMGNGNPPVYVSSVTYGRIFIGIASSKSSSRELKAAINYKLSQIVGAVDISANAEYETLLEETSFRFLVMGGPSVEGIEAVTSNDFSSYFTEGAVISNETRGVPLFFRFNYLKNNQPALLSYKTSYEVRNCEVIQLPPSAITITMDKFCVLDVSQVGEGKAELFFSSGVFDHNNEFHEIKTISRSNPVKVGDDPRCMNPIDFDNPSKLLEIPSINGMCFFVSMDFRERDTTTITDDRIGTIEKEFCYHNGNWNPSLGDFTPTLNNEGIELRAFYTVTLEE